MFVFVCLCLCLCVCVFCLFVFVFVFVCVCVCVCVFVLFVKKKKNKCPALSCFINFIFNSFVITCWMYFVVIEREKKIIYIKKKLLKKGQCVFQRFAI